MIHKYFGYVKFLDRELLISSVFAIEAKSISQVYELIQAKFKISEKQILDLKITNRKAIQSHKIISQKQWMKNSLT